MPLTRNSHSVSNPKHDTPVPYINHYNVGIQPANSAGTGLYVLILNVFVQQGLCSAIWSNIFNGVVNNEFTLLAKIQPLCQGAGFSVKFDGPIGCKRSARELIRVRDALSSQPCGPIASDVTCQDSNRTVIGRYELSVFSGVKILRHRRADPSPVKCRWRFAALSLNC
jgi:hypothetical protein